ncbi:MAG: nicotinate-nucleotide--dimethylbenzimidazole phosphoribosyltransferase [Lachnospiraceae bacterium]
MQWQEIEIEAPSEAVRKAVFTRWDGIAKPLDSLGEFERVIAQIGAIQENIKIDISRKAVLAFCADNGVVAEHISQSGQEVTALVAKNMGMGLSSVCKMAKQAGATVIPVDIGIHSDEKIEGVLWKKIKSGTNNFAVEPAMSAEEAVQAIQVGVDLVKECKEQGYGLLAIGEMGIGNTTTSSAVAAALMKEPVEALTGRGAGLSQSGVVHKIEVIQRALSRYQLMEQDALTVLATVGGLDIAGMAGVCIGGAYYHVPVVLDGVISMVAALVAESLKPGVAAYLIGSHSSREPAARLAAERLGVKPVIWADMALGEGTGAVMMFGLLDMAMTIYGGGTTFEEMELAQYERFEKK